MGTCNSRGLRGSTLEDMINHTNDLYREKKLALIQKIPTPITPVSIDKTSRHITLAYFDQKSTVDYIGVVQGIPVCFDAKECAVDTFSLQNIHPHQVEFMHQFEKQGGIAFFLIFYSHKDLLYYLPYEMLRFFWDRAQEGGRKSFRFEELNPEYIIPKHQGILVPYLDILKKAEEIIKKDPGISISHLNNREKTKIADALRQTYPLTELLHVLGLTRSSYFYHRAALKAGDKYATIRTMLTDIFNSNYQCYGYRRLHAMLRHERVRLSEKVVRRLMVEEQLVVSRNRRRRYSSYCGEIGPAPDNLIARDFKAEQPNQKWLTDITEFQLPAGKVWLSPVVDCFDGKVISWSLSTRPDAELVNTMLDSAVETLNAGERPVIHSDRGGHYRWPGWLERVNAAGLIRSMSRKGCSPDNAACEGFFGRLKTEMYYGRKWSGITPEKFMQHVDAYIRWYNERRIKLSLGAVSPEMYRQQCGLA